MNFPDIICVGLPTWSGEYAKSTVQLMSAMSVRHKILYVDYQYTWKDVLLGLINKKMINWKRVLGFLPRTRKLSTINDCKVYVLTPPPVLPINWINNDKLYELVLRFNNWIVQQSIERASNRISLRNPVIINAFNPFYSLLNNSKLQASKTVYYCYDEISSAEWIGKHGSVLEKRLIEKVDAVITSSENLFLTKKELNQKCFLVKNGVDFNLFNKSYTDNTQTNVKRRVIGYVGSIDNRLDYSLLEFIIKNLPDFEFRFIGRIIDKKPVYQLDRYENVTFTGPKDYKLLPKEISKFSIGIIPFVKNSFTRSIYPLKINEYLALGKPVVMTDFSNHLNEFKDIVSICESELTFLNTIKKYPYEGNQSDIVKRLNTAKENSWDNRGIEFSNIITA